MKHFQINNFKVAVIKCLEEIERNMVGDYVLHQ